jgi:hypothetical protein
MSGFPGFTLAPAPDQGQHEGPRVMGRLAEQLGRLVFEAGLALAGHEPDPDPDQVLDSPWWVCVFFQTRAEKERFLAAVGAAKGLIGDKHIDGRAFARLLDAPRTEAAAAKSGGFALVPKQERAHADNIGSSKRWLADQLDTEFWIALCWRTPAERDAFLRKTGARQILVDGKHIEGSAFAALAGITL